MFKIEQADIEAKVLEGAATSLAREKSFASVGYDALKKVLSSMAARTKDLISRLSQTYTKITWDPATKLILGGIRALLVPDVDPIRLIFNALRNPRESSHIINSSLAARYPWLRLFIAHCCFTTLAALPFVLIIWISSISHATGLPDTLGRSSLLIIALVVLLWIAWTAPMLEVPAPKAN